MIYSAKASRKQKRSELDRLDDRQQYYLPLPSIHHNREQAHYYSNDLQYQPQSQPYYQHLARLQGSNFALDNHFTDNTFKAKLYLDLKKYASESTPLVNNNFQHENWVKTRWILVPMLPLTFGMNILTPCKFKNTFWTIWTFVVSISLIGALTYVSVWMVHMSSRVVGIPETIAGMTILSWGTGIPELIASIVLIKKTSQADMAICNTIGSNIIDISFCLSIPW